MLVREVMTRQVEATTADATLLSAALQMKEAGVGFLPVREARRLVGVETDRDLVVRATTSGYGPEELRIRDVMTPHAQCCFDDQSLDYARELLAEQNLTRLIVLDRRGRLVGVLSRDDLPSATDARA
jgi:CBS domain-containing protein